MNNIGDKIKNLKYYNFNRLIHRFQGFPRQILIEPTNICNIRCPLCPTPHWNTTRKTGAMSFSNYKIVIDRIKDYIPSIGLFFAGEPFLNKEIFEMINYSKKFGIEVFTSTNATTFNHENIERLLKTGLDKLIISFDGLTKETYERYRIGSNYERIIESLKYLISRKKQLGFKYPFIQVQFIVMKHNQHELPLLNDFKKNLGIECIQVKSVAIPTWLKYDKIETKNLLEEYAPDEKLSRYETQNGEVNLLNKQAICEWVHKTVVLWDGTVVMCCYDFNGKFSFGNIFQQNLPEIWNSDRYRTCRKKIQLQEIELCRKCGNTNELIKKEI